MRQLTSFSIRSVLDRVPNASTCNANYVLEYRSMPKSGRRTPIFFRDEKRFLDILSGWKGPACWVYGSEPMKRQRHTKIIE
jgi:hypothetical protein